MKILMISPSYFPQRGGTEQVIFELITRLKLKYDITILTSRLDNNWKKYEEIDGIKISRINLSSNSFGIRLLINYFNFFLAGFKLHKKNKYDLIHLFHVYENGYAAYLLKKLFKIPLITSLMGWDSYDPIRKIPKRYLPFMRKVMNSSDWLTSPSNHLAKAAKEQGCYKEISVIPHGTNMHKNLIPTQIDNSIVTFLSVQRLHERKGLKYLLQAIPKIIKLNKNIHFIIVGKGPEEENLKKLSNELKINDHLTFKGFVADEDLPNIYSSSDFFILPTLYEAFGLVYADALCFGIPIITTENGGSLDIVNNKNGIIFPMEDPQAIVNAVNNAVNKNWDRKGIQRGAKQYYWENILLKYEKGYDNLIK